MGIRVTLPRDHTVKVNISDNYCASLAVGRNGPTEWVGTHVLRVGPLVHMGYGEALVEVTDMFLAPLGDATGLGVPALFERGGGWWRRAWRALARFALRRATGGLAVTNHERDIVNADAVAELLRGLRGPWVLAWDEPNRTLLAVCVCGHRVSLKLGPRTLARELTAKLAHRGCP